MSTLDEEISAMFETLKRSVLSLQPTIAAAGAAAADLLRSMFNGTTRRTEALRRAAIERHDIPESDIRFVDVQACTVTLWNRRVIAINASEK